MPVRLRTASSAHTRVVASTVADHDASGLDDLALVVGMPARAADGRRIGTIVRVVRPCRGDLPVCSFAVRLRGWRGQERFVDATSARWHPRGGWIVPGLSADDTPTSSGRR